AQTGTHRLAWPELRSQIIARVRAGNAPIGLVDRMTCLPVTPRAVQCMWFWHTPTSDRQDLFAGRFTGQRFLFH
ncbi:hypothetical protein KPA97_24280, partial [Burkholderia cenocepacia]|nr:hypothetical protein [Burkholderia cenocepacia]